ncbi:MAG TPA: molybdopterin-dependent oxidoreductase [Candidatus Manganitrophaceae bacterium]|nr:molybdopterin-dependent oxidoreductase [Candidatus Manganitrophaceae bacterium]
MREGIRSPQFADKFFRIDFESSPMPVLSLYPIPAPLKLEEVALELCGLEQHPRVISWPMLKDLPRVKLKAPLICQIFNWVETVEWEGIRLIDLLDFLKIDTHPEGYFAFYSRDRVFFEGLSRDEARDPRVLLAYGLNGAPLPEAYGGPLRLVVPFLQGYKSVKWIGAIHAFRHDPVGIKRLLGQSPTGQLNEQWRKGYQIDLPAGKMGDPPPLSNQPAPKEEERKEVSHLLLAPVAGEVAPTAPAKKPGRSGLLKEVIAVVRPGKHLATRQALEAAGIFSYTTHTVLGRSRQRGLKFESEGKEGVAIKFLPKQYFSIVIEEGRLSSAVSALIKANRTGKGAVGDGKIFVVDIDDAVRISTDERGAEAV